jgi:hypothetical protein
MDVGWSHFFDNGTYRTSAWYGGGVVGRSRDSNDELADDKES